MSLRRRLAAQQRVLDQIEWPAWVRYGLLSLVVSLAVVAVWDQLWLHTPSGDAADANPWAAALIVLSVVPWLVVGARGDRTTRPFRIVFTLSVLAPLAVLNIAGDWLGIADLSSGGPQLSLMIPMILVGQAACHGSPLTIVLALGGSLAVLVGRSVVSTDAGPYVAWYVAVELGAVFGLVLRANFLGLAQLQRERELLARQAVADERRRIAREVHDIVAHTLSVTMLHLSAARLAVDQAPERAAEALDEAKRQGRAGLADIRRIVRLLREPDDGAAWPPAIVDTTGTSPSPEAAESERALPVLDQLPELVASYRAAGVDVEVDLAGALGATMSPAVGLALYRVAQESLANAAKHGAGDAHVQLSLGTDAVALRVWNSCAGAEVKGGPGAGIRGMRERIGALGGTFRAGLAEGGEIDGLTARWEVEALLPAEVAP